MDVFITMFVVMISRYMHRFRFIKLYTLNMHTTFYVKYTLVKLKSSYGSVRILYGPISSACQPEG